MNISGYPVMTFVRINELLFIIFVLFKINKMGVLSN